MSQLSMLLVDDCPFQRVLTTILLARWGIVPLVATGGHEAIRLERSGIDDVIAKPCDPGTMGRCLTRW